MKEIYKLSILILLSGLLFSCKPEAKEDASPEVTEYFSDTWKFRSGEGVDSLWMNPDYNDSEWKEVTSLTLLSNQDAETENGFGWYRKNIRLSDSLVTSIEKKGAAMLHLGRLAATDEVWINGKPIGKTGEFPHNYKGYFDGERNYPVPADDFNLKGDNVVAVKFHDGWNTGGFLDSARISISSASTDDKIRLNINVADSDYIFMEPAPLHITVSVENKNAWKINGSLVVSLTTDDHRHLKTDSISVIAAPNSVYSESFEMKEPVPGFYRYMIQFIRNEKIICEKKFNVGYEPEKISSPIDAKPDFKEFWDNSLKKLSQVKPNYKLTLQPQYSKIDYDVYLVEMRSFGNELIRGYYAKPKRDGKHPVIIEYMGYGSSPYPPNQWWDGFAYFVLSIRGQALNKPTNRFGTWITYGLDNKDNYYYRGAFMDVVRALDFVSDRPEIDETKIAVRGGSQGGALSFAAAALDKRVKAAAPNIPFLSDYPDYFKIVGWPKSDFDYYMEEHPDAKWSDIYNLLSYFDIKNLAQWIECPLIMGIGVQDEVCPPHINFAAYNQVKSEKKWMAFPEFAHSVGKEYNDAAMEFIREKLNVE